MNSMRDFSGPKAGQLGNLAHGVQANQALLAEANQFTQQRRQGGAFDDFKMQQHTGQPQHMQSGKDMAAEFSRMTMGQRQPMAAPAPHVHQRQQFGPPSVQQMGPMPQMPMMMQPMMPPPQMLRPPMHQQQAPINLVEEKVEQKEPENEETLDHLRPSREDKEKIGKVLSDPDPKWQNSQFVNFLKELKERPAIDGDQAQQLDMVNTQKWADEFLTQQGNLPNAWDATEAYEPPVPEYKFEEGEDQYEGPDPFEEGLRLMKNGKLSEAVRAFEACIKMQPRRSEAWRYLGQCHADNENEQQAIAALTKCVELDQYDLAALLQLGVCHTNDWNRTKAVTYLERWLNNHPDYAGLEANVPAVVDPNAYNADVLRCIQLFQAAASANPSDFEVHAVLGVLHNLSREFEKAEENFKNAIKHNPNDPNMWNKLGATMANGSKSEGAISAYKRALELKPNYVRALSNLGISFANMHRNKEACVSYLASLVQNPEADNVWQHLNMALHALDRGDLTDMIKMRDPQLFRPHFDF